MKKEDILYELPPNWTKVSLGEILTLEYGKSLPKKNRQEGKYPVFGSNGIIGYHNRYLIKAPVIIIGRKGSVGAVHISIENSWPIDTTYYVKPSKELNFKFIYYILNSLNLAQLDKSTTIPGLNRENVYKQLVQLPPLDEQQRMVSKLEELLSSLEKSREQLDTSLKQLHIYRTSILKNAFEGQLTSDWRIYQENLKTQIELIDEINKFKQEQFNNKLNSGNRTNKLQKPVLLNILSKKDLLDVVELPKSWIWTRLGELSDNIEYGYTEKATKEPIGPKFLRITDIQNNLVNWDSVPYCKISNERKEKYLLQKGDLLFARTGATVGKSHLIKFTPPEAIYASYLIRVRLLEIVHREFISYFFQSEFYWKQISENQIGIGQPSVNGKKLSDLCIPVTSNCEQNQIVKILDNLMSKCENLEKSILESLDSIELMERSLLKKAINGSLVSQKDEDESATILLKRIKAEKEIYLSQVKAKKNNSINLKLMPEKLKSILQILQENSEPVSSKQLWISSDKKDDIDDFYAELKEHIESGDVIELPRNGKESFLKLADKS